jgi:hypothetical protein
MSYTWRVNDASTDEHPRREPGTAPGKVSLTSALARGGRPRSADAHPAAERAPARTHQDESSESPENPDEEALADPFDFSPRALGASTKQLRPRGATPAQRSAQLASPSASTSAQPAPPDQPPLVRVRAAIAAADLPAEPAREALTAARHWEMERIAAIVDVDRGAPQ